MLVNILYGVMEEDMNGLHGGKFTFVGFFNCCNHNKKSK